MPSATALLSLLMVVSACGSLLPGRPPGRQDDRCPGRRRGAGRRPAMMHYVGMAASRTVVSEGYSGLYVILSLFISISACTGALLAARQESSSNGRVLAAIVMEASPASPSISPPWGPLKVPVGDRDSGLGGPVDLCVGAGGGRRHHAGPVPGPDGLALRPARRHDAGAQRRRRRLRGNWTCAPRPSASCRPAERLGRR